MNTTEKALRTALENLLDTALANGASINELSCANARAALALPSEPETVCGWSIEDVHTVLADNDFKPVSDDDAQDILAHVEHHADANNGISWETFIQAAIDLNLAVEKPGTH